MLGLRFVLSQTNFAKLKGVFGKRISFDSNGGVSLFGQTCGFLQ